MNKSNFKGFERVVAKDFNTVRTPLSGANSGHNTCSDTLSDTFYIECKKRKRFSFWSLFRDTEKKAKKENKIPFCAIKEVGKNGYLIVCRPEDLWYIACGYILAEPCEEFKDA